MDLSGDRYYTTLVSCLREMATATKGDELNIAFKSMEVPPGWRDGARGATWTSGIVSKVDTLEAGSSKEV